MYLSTSYVRIHVHVHVHVYTCIIIYTQAVELENASPRNVTKYLALVATNGYQDTDEAIVLGTEQEDSV